MMNKHLKLETNVIEIEENALMEFQFALLDAMKAAGISQNQLADRLGVTRARVSQLLSSSANPTIKLVGRALAALDMKAEYGNLTKRSDVTSSEVSKYQSVTISFPVDMIQVTQVQSWNAETSIANENRSEFRMLEAA